MRVTFTFSRLASVAREIIASDGVENLHIRKVAARVGVTASAVFRHFGTRDHLIDVAVSQQIAHLASLLVQNQDIEPAARLRRMTRDALSFALGSPRLFALAFAREREPTFLFENLMAVVGDRIQRAAKAEGGKVIYVEQLALGWLALLVGALAIQRAAKLDDDALHRMCQRCAEALFVDRL